MHPYELIVFDWDGTIMDSTALIASCIQAAFRDLGLPIPAQSQARYVIGMGFTDTLDHIAPQLDEARRRALGERYRHHFLARESEAPLYPGIPELLADLKGRGRRLAIATGKARRGLERALDATGLRPWFEATRCADEGFAKPHPEMLLALLDFTGVAPQRALMVGDTVHDLDLAANAGVDAVAVLYGAHDAELLATRAARARLASVAELHRWLTAPG